MLYVLALAGDCLNFDGSLTHVRLEKTLRCWCGAVVDCKHPLLKKRRGRSSGGGYGVERGSNPARTFPMCEIDSSCKCCFFAFLLFAPRITGLFGWPPAAT